MQALERTAAMFCTACICAELVSHFVGHGWGQKCIKVVAGLYILVVLTDALSGIKPRFLFSALPQSEPVFVGTMDEAILTQAEEELAAALSEKCCRESGSNVTLNIILGQTTNEVVVQSVSILSSEELDADRKQKIAAVLTEQLQISPENLVWELPGGENVT